MISKNPTSKTLAASALDHKTIEAQVVAAISALLASPSDTPTIQAVATLLQIQVRTLQRRLGDNGLQFRSLLSECQRHQALEELSIEKLQIKDVSSRLGYSDPAHFARAFRRWTGRSPIEFRSRMLKLKADARNNAKPSSS